MLRECLRSIAEQGNVNIEVLVGNDYPPEPVTKESLGIDDTRVRIINRPENLGELTNMNALLDESRGEYFTWLADDDLYLPGALAKISTLIEKYDRPACIYSSFHKGTEIDEADTTSREEVIIEGCDFLRKFTEGEISVAGCYGFFHRDFIQKIGGMRKFGSGFSPYSEHFIIFNAALLEKIVYLPEELVMLRTHADSLSVKSGDLVSYFSAQQEMIGPTEALFAEQTLRRHYQKNLKAYLHLFIRDFRTVTLRAGKIRWGLLIRFHFFIRNFARQKGLQAEICPYLNHTVYELIRRLSFLRIFADVLVKVKHKFSK